MTPGNKFIEYLHNCTNVYLYNNHKESPMTTKQTNDPNKVRGDVKNAYAAAITKATQPSTGCCVSNAVSKILPSFIGYENNQLQELPIKTEIPTFGCGNPLGFSKVQSGETVLDLGSGAGLDLIIASEKVGPKGQVIGVDMTDEMINTATKNIDDAGITNVSIRKGVIEELPVQSNSVDWVISNCVINLSPEKSKVFAEIFRVLKPGGHMLVSDIVGDDLPDWIIENDHLYSSCIAGAVSEAEYIQGLEQAGLSNVTVVDKHTYSKDEISTLTECGCGNNLNVDETKIAYDLGGKIHSIKVSAIKKQSL